VIEETDQILMSNFSRLDGRWVDDDDDEEKVLAEVEERGAKPGDLVGDLSEPQVVSNEAVALGSTQAKIDRSGGSGLGMYRAGGPTTIFGGSGWGPYSDGPLNAVRKSLLNRDGLNEENWMHIAAQRTADSGAEWAKIRREGLALGGIKGRERENGDAEGTSSKRGEEGLAGDGKRKKLKTGEEDLPLGAYEPHSGNIFCECQVASLRLSLAHFCCVADRADTQPTRSRWETLPDSAEQRQLLGGTKTGNGAWALAWVDTVMELLGDEEVDDSAAKEREALMSLVEAS
jgi:chromatin structure-remodeling complex protein RSC7